MLIGVDGFTSDGGVPLPTLNERGVSSVRVDCGGAVRDASTGACPGRLARFLTGGEVCGA